MNTKYVGIGLLLLLGLLAWIVVRARAVDGSYEVLMSEITQGDLKGVQAQLSAGADPNGASAITGRERVSPLNAAIATGREDVVVVLLDRGADVNMRDGWLATPLAEAADQGNAELIELLISRGATVNDEPTGSRALVRAVLRGHVNAARTLLTRGADPNTRMPDGTTVLELAVRMGDKGVISLLKQSHRKVGP